MKVTIGEFVVTIDTDLVSIEVNKRLTKQQLDREVNCICRYLQNEGFIEGNIRVKLFLKHELS